MGGVKSGQLPEIFRPDDARWASRAAARGEIRRLARGLYSTNLDEPAERLLRRRWFDVAALYFPDAVVVDRSAVGTGPADDGSLFLDSGPGRTRPRAIQLPGLTLRPRPGPGPVAGDMPFARIWMSSPARTLLDNMRPSRARSGVARTLRQEELEERLDGIARARGEAALTELRESARAVAAELGATVELDGLDKLIGALLGTRDVDLRTHAARARRAGLAYDADRMRLFELLRAGLASTDLAIRPAPADPERHFAFFEAYFSNWIEGTEFGVREAEQIVFEGRVPPGRPADAHDVRGTFEAITDARLGSATPSGVDELEDLVRETHRRVMGGRPEVRPGEYKLEPNRAGLTEFVRPDLVRGTLRESFAPYETLGPGLPRATYMLFAIAEVHPFADGNGRVARAMACAELSAAGSCRVMIPISYRGEYLGGLRALSRGENPRALVRVVDRAQRWASLMTWTEHDRLLELMERTNALVDPDEVPDREIHLLDP